MCIALAFTSHTYIDNIFKGQRRPSLKRKAVLAENTLSIISSQQSQVVTFSYTNYKGILSNRSVQPIEIRFGSTEWHQDAQWLLKAFDLDKNDIREFAVKDIKNWN